MTQSRLQRVSIILIALVFGVSTFVPNDLVKAQFDFGAVSSVPVNSSTANNKLDSVNRAINGQTSGPLGTTIGTITDILGDIRGALTQECRRIIEEGAEAGAASFLASLNASALEIIGGSQVEAGLTTAQAKAMKLALDCVRTYVDALKNTQATNLQASQDIQREQQTFEGIRDALSQRMDAMNARASASWKDVLRAFMVKTILSINKSLTTELVNKMINKYKISDYLAYGDALATQVYSMKYIADSFEGDAEKQLMVRSLLQSEKLPGKIQTVQAMATSQAQKFIGEACKIATPQAQQDEMYFINCVKALGSPRADKNYHISQAIDLANAANSAGKQTAAAEVTQSNGYAPPRNCLGSIAQQKGIDARVDAAAIALQNAIAIKQRLVAGGAAASEIAKAQAALDQAQANYDALFAQLSAGGGSIGDNGKAKSGAIIDICEAITSPAEFVSTSLNNFLKQHLDQTSQLKSDNLPWYLNLLSDVTSNFLTNILTGNKPNSQVLKEAGVTALNGTIIAVNQQINNGGNTGGTPPPATTGNVTVTARPASGTEPTTTLTAGQPYVLVINFRDLIATAANGKDPIFNPYRALITGVSGQSDSNVTLTAADLAAGNIAFDFTPTVAGSFTIRVQFFARGTQASPGDVPLNTGGGWSQSFTVGAVRGQATSVSYTGFSPRGPVQSFR